METHRKLEKSSFIKLIDSLQLELEEELLNLGRRLIQVADGNGGGSGPILQQQVFSDAQTLLFFHSTWNPIFLNFSF